MAAQQQIQARRSPLSARFQDWCAVRVDGSVAKRVRTSLRRYEPDPATVAFAEKAMAEAAGKLGVPKLSAVVTNITSGDGLALLHERGGVRVRIDVNVIDHFQSQEGGQRALSALMGEKLIEHSEGHPERRGPAKFMAGLGLNIAAYTCAIAGIAAMTAASLALGGIPALMVSPLVGLIGASTATCGLFALVGAAAALVTGVAARQAAVKCEQAAQADQWSRDSTATRTFDRNAMEQGLRGLTTATTSVKRPDSRFTRWIIEHSPWMRRTVSAQHRLNGEPRVADTAATRIASVSESGTGRDASPAPTRPREEAEAIVKQAGADLGLNGTTAEAHTPNGHRSAAPTEKSDGLLPD